VRQPQHSHVAEALRKANTLITCCSVLQCVAVCCSVLQCVAVCSCCSVLQCVASEEQSPSSRRLLSANKPSNSWLFCRTRPATLQHPTTYCNTLRHFVAILPSKTHPIRAATYCNTLQHAATYWKNCNTTWLLCGTRPGQYVL